MLSETFAHGAPLANSVSRQIELCESPQAARGHHQYTPRVITINTQLFAKRITAC